MKTRLRIALSLACLLALLLVVISLPEMVDVEGNWDLAVFVPPTPTWPNRETGF